MNYSQGGRWRAIDSTLVESSVAGYAYRNRADGYALDLPADLGARPVRVRAGGHSLSFALEGAAGRAAVSGPRARYAEALPGVSVDYTAGGQGVKEVLALASRSAPSSYRFALDLSDGLRPRETGAGSIELRDADGRPRFVLAAPWLEDAAGARSDAAGYRLEQKGGGGYELVLRAERAWLDAPERRYPVKLDPTVYVDPTRDCTLAGASPAQTLCDGQTLEVGTTGGAEARAVLSFDVESAVPKGALVFEAYLWTHVAARVGAGDFKDWGVYRLTRPFGAGVSWNDADTGAPWTTAGGDFAPDPYFVRRDGGTGGDYFASWAATRLVQEWRDGTHPNNGMLLKEASAGDNRLVLDSFEATTTANRPFLGITWLPRLGARREHTFVEQRLSERMGVGVNVGNGNALVRNRDLQIKGTGLDLRLERYHNNGDYQRDLHVGSKWQLSLARLAYSAGDSRAYTDPSGATYVFERQRDGAFKSPPAVDAKLEPDGAGHKLSFNKTKEVMRFNADGDLTRHEDRNGNAIAYSYSEPRRLAQVTDTQGRVTALAYNASGDLEQITDPSGRSHGYAYDSYGRLTTYTDPAGGITRYRYQGQDDLTEITDPRGVVTKLEHDAQMRVIKIRRDFDPATWGSAALWSFAYESPTAPCDPQTDLRKTVVTDPRGNQTSYCSDVQGRVTKALDAQGHERSAEYTPNSDVKRFEDGAAGPVTTLQHNQATNNLESGTLPAGETFSLAYESPAQPFLPTSATNPQGNATAFAYTTEGNLSTVTNGKSPTQVEAKLEYNGQAGGSCPDDATTKPGTLRCAIDGNGNRTSYEHDAQGNLTRVVPPLPVRPTSFTYDALSRLKTIYDGQGVTKTFFYDALDRVRRVEWNSQGAPFIDFSYDANGNLTRRLHFSDGATDFVYDDFNRQLKETLPDAKTNQYGYDAASNLTSLTDPGGTVAYAYDSLDRLSKLTEPDGLATSFGYDARGNRTSTSFPNGVVETSVYDDSDKQKSVEAKKGATALTRFTYTFRDAQSRETRLRQSVTDKDANTTTYAYDGLDRLTRALTKDAGGATIDDRLWSYDGASNRTRQTVNGGITSYAYNPGNQLCWQAPGELTAGCGAPPAGATSYGYDLNGNETQGSGGRGASYNVKNQLVMLTPAGASTISMEYRGDDQAERFRIGSTGVHNNLLGVGAEDATHWTRDSAGNVIAQRAGTAKHYYLRDALGSIVALTDAGGAVAASYGYDPYGNTTAETGSVPNPWRFAGEHREADGSFLYKIGLRYYDPSIGRWTQLDPLDRPADLRQGNRYVYVGADPVNITDPTGALFGIDDFGDVTETVAEVAATGLAATGTVAAGLSGAAATTGCLAASRGAHAAQCAQVAAAFIGLTEAGATATGFAARRIFEDN